MQILTSADVLELSDCGQGRDPIGRALLILAAAQPTLDPERCADLPIGTRDAAIMQFRCANFGRWLGGCVTCSDCGAQLEFDIDLDQVLSEKPPAPDHEFVASNRLRFRLPASRDLIAVAQSGDLRDAARQIVARCCLDGRPAEALSDALVAEVEAGLAANDSFADIEISFDCAACGKIWAAPLDIAAWVWEEIEQRARQLLDDVHVLAAHYGWTEPEVLKLSAERRAAYLARCAP